MEAAINSHIIRTLFAASFAALLPGLTSAQEAELPGQDWPKTLIIGTASPGGTYYSYGEGVANFVRNGFLPFHEGARRWYQNASDTIIVD